MNIRVSSNIDSSVIGCIPEGKIVKVLGVPIEGYVSDISGHWYKVERLGSAGFIWGGLLEFYSLASQAPESIAIVERNEKTDEKKLAKEVIDMIKSGREIFFEYKDGKLVLEMTSRSDDRDGYPDRGGYPGRDGYPPRDGAIRNN